ncbi:MAG: MCP four helix bundle domain-containing protein, partial [Firmicutes bacterium]|nr:MCP four helix bundle domain-containing protein [Bacillota bacterium]
MSFKFGTKIGLGFGLVLVLLVIISAIAVSSLLQIHNDEACFYELLQENMAISRINYLTAMESSSMRGRLYYQDPKYLDDYRYYRDENRNLIDGLLAGARTEEDRRYMQRIKTLAEAYANILDNKIEPLAAQGKYKEAGDTAVSEGLPALNQLNQLTREYEQKRISDFYKMTEAAVATSKSAVSLV